MFFSISLGNLGFGDLFFAICFGSWGFGDLLLFLRDLFGVLGISFFPVICFVIWGFV